MKPAFPYFLFYCLCFFFAATLSAQLRLQVQGDGQIIGGLTLGQGLQLGNSNINTAGTLRWTGTDFQVYDGSRWQSLLDRSGTILWQLNGSDIYYDAGRVGIGLSSPKTGLHLNDNQSLLIGADTTGEGTKLVYWADLGAFRAGTLDELSFTPELEANNWDRDSVGRYSFASGRNTIASGDYSFIGGGFSNTASGAASFVCGSNNKVSGFYSFAGGNDNTASGSFSFVGGGVGNKVSGSRSFVGGGEGNMVLSEYSFVGGGRYNIAPGQYSFVGGGRNNTASGWNSFVGGGGGNAASGWYSFVGGGVSLKAPSYSETVFGYYNEDYTPDSNNGPISSDRLFVIGNGTSPTNRSNALTVLKNGNLGIGTSAPQALLHLSYTGGSNGITIEGDNTGDARLRIHNIGGGNHFLFDDLSESNALSLESSGSLRFYTSGPSERMRIDPVGRVGIGKTPATTAGLLLDVNGDVYANGNLLTSDRRLKENIKAITNPLLRLQEINGWSYSFNTRRFADRNFPEGPQLGMIAQEIEAVFPELVKTHSDGYKAVNYDGLIPVLIEGMKALASQVDEQQKLLDVKAKKIRKLEVQLAKVDQLEAQMHQLENQLYDCCRRDQLLLEPSPKQATIPPTDGAYLKQNRPNPFHLQTAIEYYLPPGSQGADLYISDLSGRLLKTFHLASGGTGNLQLDGALLDAGIYLYTLVVGGKIVDTKKMLLTK